MSDAEYFSAAEDLRGEDWEVELRPEAPSPSFFDDPPAAEPPTSPGPPPMPDDAAPNARRSRRQRGGRKVQRRRRNKAARQAAAAAAIAAAPLTNPATTTRQRNRRRWDPALVIYRWGSDMSGKPHTGSRRDWWTSWMSTLIRTSSPVRRACRSMSRVRHYVIPARRPWRGPFHFSCDFHFCSTWLDHVCALSLPLKFTFLYGYMLSAFLFHVAVYARGRALLEEEAM